MNDELTAVDIRKMQEEIEYREQVLMPQIIKDVQTARAFGDLSENYEYKAAKQELRRCDSRLRYLRRMIATAKVIEVKGEGQEQMVKVDFGERGVRTFSANIAPIIKVED